MTFVYVCVGVCVFVGGGSLIFTPEFRLSAPHNPETTQATNPTL